MIHTDDHEVFNFFFFNQQLILVLSSINMYIFILFLYRYVAGCLPGLFYSNVCFPFIQYTLYYSRTIHHHHQIVNHCLLTQTTLVNYYWTKKRDLIQLHKQRKIKKTNSLIYDIKDNLVKNISRYFIY